MDRERVELSISGCKPDVFPLALHPRITWSQWSESNTRRLGPKPSDIPLAYTEIVEFVVGRHGQFNQATVFT